MTTNVHMETMETEMEAGMNMDQLDSLIGSLMEENENDGTGNEETVINSLIGERVEEESEEEEESETEVEEEEDEKKEDPEFPPLGTEVQTPSPKVKMTPLHGTGKTISVTPSLIKTLRYNEPQNDRQFTQPCRNVARREDGTFGVCRRRECTFAHSLAEYRGRKEVDLPPTSETTRRPRSSVERKPRDNIRNPRDNTRNPRDNTCTQPCRNVVRRKDGKFSACNREWCTFAHSLAEYRAFECHYDCGKNTCRFKHSTENVKEYLKRTGKTIDLPATSKPKPKFKPTTEKTEKPETEKSKTEKTEKKPETGKITVTLPPEAMAAFVEFAQGKNIALTM